MCFEWACCNLISPQIETCKHFLSVLVTERQITELHFYYTSHHPYSLPCSASCVFRAGMWFHCADSKIIIDSKCWLLAGSFYSLYCCEMSLFVILVKNCLQWIQACFNGQVHSDRRTHITGLMQTLWLERDLEFGLCFAGTLQHNVVLVQMPPLVSSLNWSVLTNSGWSTVSWQQKSEITSELL